LAGKERREGKRLQIRIPPSHSNKLTFAQNTPKKLKLGKKERKIGFGKGKLVTDASVGSFGDGDWKIGGDQSLPTSRHGGRGGAGEVVAGGERGGPRRQNGLVGELLHSEKSGGNDAVCLGHFWSEWECKETNGNNQISAEARELGFYIRIDVSFIFSAPNFRAIFLHCVWRMWYRASCVGLAQFSFFVKLSLHNKNTK